MLRGQSIAPDIDCPPSLSISADASRFLQQISTEIAPLYKGFTIIRATPENAVLARSMNVRSHPFELEIHTQMERLDHLAGHLIIRENQRQDRLRIREGRPQVPRKFGTPQVLEPAQRILRDGTPQGLRQNLAGERRGPHAGRPSRIRSPFCRWFSRTSKWPARWSSRSIWV